MESRSTPFFLNASSNFRSVSLDTSRLGGGLVQAMGVHSTKFRCSWKRLMASTVKSTGPAMLVEALVAVN
jgi:hypothetical protein